MILQKMLLSKKVRPVAVDRNAVDIIDAIVKSRRVVDGSWS